MPALALASPGRARRQERAREVMRQRIADAAMQLFLDEGFERTSIRRIADAIDYTPGAIYSYFGDKDDILFALHTEGFAKLRTLLRSLDANALSPRERLVRVGELYLRFAFENPHYYALMFIMASTGKKIEEQGEWLVGLDTYDFLRGIVADCMGAGVLPAGDLEAATFAVWASVHGLASLVIRGRCPMIPDDALAATVAQAYRWTIDAITAPQRSPSPARPGKPTPASGGKPRV
jgi:AcrR family transcriptional regulator